uniref:NADH-ubiquinone oxidoreductase chain 2 n=1 Tax=Psococerastis albimaculata TaxID=1264641 RepID=M9P720_9NEOP|nr:NADH dehydrogenase subunit 2 [Psococerastis albimaculata]AFY16884.1 NADH dehydrogenase subunit 2 [Psococerastis albimaculata]
MLNNLNILFSFMMIISSLISISSSNWLGAWMGLEINMISFIPLITNNKNILSNESALKYFLIQAIASCSFLSFCLLNTFNSSIMSSITIPTLLNILLSTSLMLKLGATPFQSWFIMVMEGLTWLKCLILMTWQKIAPIFILFYIVTPKIVMPFCVMSLLMGSLGALNQTSLKKIMAYSSINHLGWMMTATFMNKFLLILYFSTYFLLNIFTLMNFMKLNTIHFNQIFSKNSFHFSVSLLSLAGLPPFLGFLPKWLIINNLMSMNMNMLCLVMIMTALITTFFYIRLIINSMIMINYTEKYLINMTFHHTLFTNMNLMISCGSLFLFNFFS